MKITTNLLIFILLSLLYWNNVHAQQTKIRGKIIDTDTKEPLPFVNITFKGTTIGTITDFDGNYFLQARTQVNIIVVSFVGYVPQEIEISKNVYQELNIEMKSSDVALDEIVIKPGENPAWRIMRNIVKNKKKNDPSRYESYEYESYNKMEIDANNIDDDFRKKNLFNKFDFIFNYVDTSAETGKSYLPIFITETLSDIYYQRRPKRNKEIIKASRISGVENESVTQYTGQMYVDVNIYDNFLEIFDKPFVSPISDYWKLYYKYYLVDSMYIDGQYCYQLSFRPQRKQELTFTGDFWVHDTTWAIKKAKVRIAEDANINYIYDFIAQVQFSRIGDTVWFLTKEEMFVDFNITDRTMGFFGRKTTSRKNIVVNKSYDKKFFSDEEPQQSIVLDGATKFDTAFWNSNRHEKLSQKEENIYAMVDSIKDVPVFRTITDIVQTLLMGYYVKGYWEYGPYFKFFSHNQIEGFRFRFGGRTSNKFSTKIMLHGHIAYGTKDNVFKYGGGATYMFNKVPRRCAFFQHKYDVEQLGLSINAFTEDNILATLLSRSPSDNLLMVRETKAYYEHEWFLGFSNTLNYSLKQIYPSESITFKNQTNTYKQLTSTEVTLSTRMAYNEKFVQGEFERISFGSEYPVVRLDITAGLKNTFGSDFEYYRLKLNISHHFNILPFGFFKYSAEAGKVFGTVPFPLLKLHEGNETYAFDAYAFNMMNFYEFASDTYASLYLEHHFNGLFLNKFPLLRKLKWREIVYAKGLIGQISDKNNKSNGFYDFPASLGDVNKPYVEAGVGLENIFRLIRIDAIWRLSYLDNPDAPRFGIRAKVQIIL